MKEPYGWYPPQRNIYEPKGNPTPYHADCLYRFHKSVYYSPPVQPPQPSLMVLGHAPPTGTPRPETAPAPTPTPPPQYVIQFPQSPKRHRTVIRARSAPAVPKFSVIPQLHLPTPQEAWQAAAEEAKAPHPPCSPSPRPPSSVRWPMPQRPGSKGENSSKEPKAVWMPATSRTGSRVRSATIHRERQSVPQRPAFSAGPRRLETQTTPRDERGRDEEPESDEEAEPVEAPPSRPPNPAPSLESLAEEPECHAPTQEEVEAGFRAFQAEFQATKDRFGWRAEVHGNPFKLKKMMKRLPYAVKCPEPEVRREAPRAHMTNYDTFFYNTIPHRHATFDVKADWISEVLHAKRMELQQREGFPYRTRTFAFAY